MTTTARRRTKAEMKHDGFPFIDSLHLHRESDISLWLGYKDELGSSERLLLKIIRRHNH